MKAVAVITLSEAPSTPGYNWLGAAWRDELPVNPPLPEGCRFAEGMTGLTQSSRGWHPQVLAARLSGLASIKSVPYFGQWPRQRGAIAILNP